MVLITACLVLAGAGLRSVLESTPLPQTAAPSVEPVSGPVAEALAEAFVRAYLTWDGATNGDRLAPLSTVVEPPQVAPGLRQRVAWTTVAGSERHGRQQVVTVAAVTDHRAYHVAVTVTRDRHGILAISRTPAVVGAPPIDRARFPTPEREIDDRGLATVLRRALKNYLARDRADLLADLDGGADVALPDQPLRLRDVEALTWAARPRRAAVELRARTAPGVPRSRSSARSRPVAG